MLNIKYKSLLGWGVRLAIAILIFIVTFGCGVVPQLREGSESAYIRLPFVRVLLDNSASRMEISSTGSYSLECLRGGRSYVYYSSQPLAVEQDRGLLAVMMRREKLDGRYEEVIMTPRSGNDFLDYHQKRYRGMFRIMPRGMNLQLINVVHMDDYLKGVVPPEIGKVGDAELEAVKAQAVAARTYSMAHLGQYKGEQYDMRSDVSDQLYGGANIENDIVSQAVDDTRGYVIKYEDNLINAYYHSTCGGYTDDIDEVWDKPSAPYLRAIDDSGICGWSNYTHWSESYTAAQLITRIEQFLSSDRGREIHIGDIIDMKIISRTAGGRVAELTVNTTTGDYNFGKDRIRWLFKRSSNPELILQSARFDLDVEHDGSGRLSRVELKGSGYGHGVGMCQCGAIGMARAGRKFSEIIPFYYRNTRLVKLY